MPRRLTVAEVKWLLDNCLESGATADQPAWPPGAYFRSLLKCSMRDSVQLEVSYLMLVPGKHLRLTVQDVAAILERFEQTVYHGTSLGALCGIMGTGFRPSLGAGSDEAGKQYNCALPMVYTSALLETAAGYVGNERSGQRIGEGPAVNCVIWLKADPQMRLYRKKPVKNKSGQHRNEQQGYHPQDLVVSQIFLHCVETGTVTPHQARFGLEKPDGKALRRMSADLRAAAAMLFDAEQAPWWSAPMAKVQLKKKGSIALLRNRTRRVLKRWRKKRRARERVA